MAASPTFAYKQEPLSLTWLAGHGPDLSEPAHSTSQFCTLSAAELYTVKYLFQLLTSSINLINDNNVDFTAIL